MYRGYLHQMDGLSACIYIGKVKQFQGSRFLSWEKKRLRQQCGLASDLNVPTLVYAYLRLVFRAAGL